MFFDHILIYDRKQSITEVEKGILGVIYDRPY